MRFPGGGGHLPPSLPPKIIQEVPARLPFRWCQGREGAPGIISKSPTKSESRMIRARERCDGGGTLTQGHSLALLFPPLEEAQERIILR
jgi:hypothetical protein